MAPPRQQVKTNDIKAMKKAGEEFTRISQVMRVTQRQLDRTVALMTSKGYNVSAIAREMGVTRNVVYRSLERSGIAPVARP